MRKLEEVTGALDLDQELKHLGDYIKLKWEPLANIEEIFKLARDAAVTDARAWFDQHAVWEALVAVADARATALTAAVGTEVMADLYDGPCHALAQAQRALDAAYAVALQLEHAPWDFSRQVSRLTGRIKTDYPLLATARPLGWDHLAEGYSDFDGQETYCRTQVTPDQALFQGLDVQGTLSLDFVYGTALPYVMYDVVCQGTTAPQVLVGAIYGYFLGIQQHRNTEAIKEAITQLAQELPAPNELAFNVTLTSKQPHLAVLLQLQERPAPTREAYLNAQAQQAAFKALSPAEQEARRKGNEARMMEILSQSLSDERNPAKEQARQAEEQAQRTRITTLFRAALQ